MKPRSRPGAPPRRGPCPGPRAAVLALVLLGLALTGCVERVLVLSSTPPGARAIVDGRDRGVTPVRIPYVHDGRFRVRLELEGYESVADEVTTRTGPDAVPGLDFLAENLWPGTIRRTTAKDYRLVPLKRSSYAPEDLKAVLDRAEAFRERARREAAEAGTPPPTRPGTAAPAPRAPAPTPPPAR